MDVKSNTVGSRLHSDVDSMKANAVVVESRLAVIEAGNHGKWGMREVNQEVSTSSDGGISTPYGE